MSQTIVAKEAEITLIDTCRLQVNQEVTDLRWDNVKKHPDIQLLNSVVTAKLVSQKSGTKAILSKKGYLIGTDSESLTYKIHQGSKIHVGFAENTRELDNLQVASDLVSTPITITNDENLKMTLAPGELTITHGGTSVVLDLTPHVGKTMYPWLSDAVGGTGFSVSIIKTSRLSIYIAENGTVVFKTTADGGVDRPIKFDTGVSPVEFTGGGLITDTVHDIVESTLGTPLTLREIGGADVVINSFGDLDTPGEISTAKVVTPAVEAPVAADLVLTNNGGGGLTIDSGTSVGTFTANVAATGFVSDSFTSTSGNGLDLVELDSGLGIHIDTAPNSGDVSMDTKLNVMGDVQFGTTLNVTGAVDFGLITSDGIKSNAATDLDLTENGGLGIHITTGTGVVTLDDHIVTSRVRSTSGDNLLLQNWGNEGLTVSGAAGGAVTCATVLTVNNEIYGTSGLTLHNSIGDGTGITIAPVSGDVTCDGGVAAGGEISTTGALDVATTGKVGPTSLPASACFSMSSAGLDKAVLMPVVSATGAVTTPILGMVVFQTADNLFYGYTGSGWQKFAMGDHTIDT